MTAGGESRNADQMARWRTLKFQFPQAAWSLGGDGWYYGALRDEDTELRRATLGALIDALAERDTAGTP